MNQQSKGATKMKKNGAATERAVMVTTAHRGVFFGYANDVDGKTIKLKRARMCVSWSRAMKGVLGLASIGPDKDCRIGAPADIEVRDITSVAEVTGDAVKRWEEAPWRA